MGRNKFSKTQIKKVDPRQKRQQQVTQATHMAFLGNKARANTSTTTNFENPDKVMLSILFMYFILSSQAVPVAAVLPRQSTHSPRLHKSSVRNSGTVCAQLSSYDSLYQTLSSQCPVSHATTLQHDSIVQSSIEQAESSSDKTTSDSPHIPKSESDMAVGQAITKVNELAADKPKSIISISDGSSCKQDDNHFEQIYRERQQKKARLNKLFDDLESLRQSEDYQSVYERIFMIFVENYTDLMPYKSYVIEESGVIRKIFDLMIWATDKMQFAMEKKIYQNFVSNLPGDSASAMDPDVTYKFNLASQYLTILLSAKIQENKPNSQAKVLMKFVKKNYPRDALLLELEQYLANTYWQDDVKWKMPGLVGHLLEFLVVDEQLTDDMKRLFQEMYKYVFATNSRNTDAIFRLQHEVTVSHLSGDSAQRSSQNTAIDHHNDEQDSNQASYKPF